MSKEDRLKFLLWNRAVTGKNFVARDPDDYIYASLSQPPVKVVNKHNSDDEMDWDVECPNCHKVVNYGWHLYSEAGQLYCDSEGCYKEFKLSGKGNRG